MSNPTRTTGSTPVAKKKKKKSSFNWKQALIIGAMALALLSMVAPNIRGLFMGMKKRPPIDLTSPDMEPKFQKEGELSFVSGATGQPVTKIDIEKADNETDRQFGLMFRRSMPESQGMLFLFETSGRQSFWMHNTYIPLDIIFVDENNVINTIHKNAKPLNDTSLPSKGNAKYVVEVVGGFSDKYGLKEGDKISWQ
ncbi:MAG: DUF192 domain-containing protein [Bacteroidetes bacterium]|nr:DUF192 domain-containing protein [Bacteroidota bacterium]